MAAGDDQARLLVNIEASQARFAKQLAAIAKAAGVTAGGIEKNFAVANNNVAKGFDRTAASAQRAARAQETAFRQSRAVATNLSFQLQDIAQGLMVGTSPFTLMAQQGGQVVQALSMAPGGAGGAIRALGSAVGGLINPMSLATFAIIGLGAAAVQYFTNLLSDGEVSNAELKRQEERIQAIADKWGAALPALKAYVDERARLKAIEDIEFAAGEQRKRTWEDAKNQVRDLRLSIAAVVADLQQGGADGGQVAALQRAFEALDAAVQSNKATAEDAKRVQMELMALYINTGQPVDDLARAFADYGAVLDEVSGKSAQLDEQAARTKALADAAARLQSVIDGFQSEKTRKELQSLADKAEEGEISVDELRIALANLSSSAPDLSSHISEFMRLIGVIRQTKAEASGFSGRESQGGRVRYGTTGFMQLPKTVGTTPTARVDPYFQDWRTKSGGGKSEAEREAEAIAKLIDSLEHELSLIGQTAEEQAVMNNLRKLAASATDEQRDKVEELTRTLFRQKEAQKAATKAMEDMRALGKDVLSGFIKDIRNGVSAADALSNALSKVADKLLDMALDNLFSGGFGKGGLLGGFLIPGILHGGGVAGRDGYGHGRAVSPSVFSGAQRYHSGGIAGLQPGEVPAILQKGEVVLPRGTKMGGGTSIVINAPINAPGADAAALARVEASVKDLGRNIPKMVDQRVNARQTRGTRP